MASSDVVSVHSGGIRGPLSFPTHSVNTRQRSTGLSELHPLGFPPADLLGLVSQIQVLIPWAQGLGIEGCLDGGVAAQSVDLSPSVLRRRQRG